MSYEIECQNHPDTDVVFDVPLTLAECRMVAKSLGITLDVMARKLEQFSPNSRRSSETARDYAITSSALSEVRDVLDKAIAL
jgi:hypothetical protein